MTRDGKPIRVLISGASRGLGKSLALTFGREGHVVLVHYHEASMAALEVAQSITKAGGTAFAFSADVSRREDVVELVEQARQRWGGLDMVIHSAGILSQRLTIRQSELDWDRVIQTNLTGAYFIIRAAADVMQTCGGGHILTIASRAGLCGEEGLGAYASSKAGLIGLSKACARELGPLNIRVNCILPGYLDTELGRQAAETVAEKMLSENVLGRFSTIEEVSRFIYALSLMESVSGQVFQLDSRIAWIS